MAVEDIIEAQQEYATEAIDSANSVVGELADMAGTSYFHSVNVGNIPPPAFDWDVIDNAESLLNQFFPEALEVDDIVAAKPDLAQREVDDMPDVSVPEFTASAPTLNLPTAPSTVLPGAPTAPIVADPVMPAAPQVTMPVAPTFAGVVFPEVPSIEIPEFESELPIDDLVAPTNNFSFAEEIYASEILDSLKAKLLSDMENGTYGIEPGDEALLWERARTRELENAMQEAEQLIADAAGRGFPLPPGDMNVSLQRAQQRVQDKLSDVNRDIMIKRGDMYVEGRKFTIQEVRGLETVLINFHNSRMERSLNASKAVLEASISVYNALVARYNARMEGYKASAVVFETRLRASLARTEIYKVQMEGKRLEIESNKALVDIYNAQLNGVNSIVNMYKTQVDAAAVTANVEQLRIQAFRGLVDAYAAQVQAKVAEFQMFEAQTRGEIAKVQAYDTQAQAYRAVVDGVKARADIAIAKLRGQVEVAGHDIQVFNSRMSAYQTDVNAQAQTIDAKVRAYTGQITAGTAKSNALAESLRLDVAQKDLSLRRNIENAKIDLEEARLAFGAAEASARTRVGAASAASQYYTALVGAAVNSINTLSSIIAQE